MLVNFMLIGAQKSGTTSLAYQLEQHPQISFCFHKEPDFFSKSLDWKKEIDSYHQLYPQSPGKVYGEASTTYTWLPEYPHTSRRLFAYNPELNLIYLVRHPVERAISHLTYHLLKARTRFPPEIEIFAEPGYINHSRYALQLRPYLELFPPQNIHIMIFEEYIRNPLQALYQLAAHIGVDPCGFERVDLQPQNLSLDRPAEHKIKRTLTPVARLFPLSVRNALRGPFTYRLKHKVEISLETRRLLWRFLEDDVRLLEGMLGRPVEAWQPSV